MIISIRQIRAARGLLGWNQGDLAQATGLSQNALSDLEQEKVMPRTKTLDRLRVVFEDHAIEFLEDDGVRIRHDRFKVHVFEGKNAFIEHVKDLIHVGKQTRCVFYHHANDEELSAQYPKEWYWYYEQLLKHDLKEKLIMPDTVKTRYAAHSTTDIRLANTQLFGKKGFSVYHDRYALYLPNRLVIIQSQEIADAHLEQFQFEWDRSKPMPKISSIFEKLKQKKP